MRSLLTTGAVISVATTHAFQGNNPNHFFNRKSLTRVQLNPSDVTQCKNAIETILPLIFMHVSFTSTQTYQGKPSVISLPAIVAVLIYLTYIDTISSFIPKDTTNSERAEEKFEQVRAASLVLSSITTYEALRASTHVATEVVEHVTHGLSVI
jgi:hypothetical protein